MTARQALRLLAEDADDLAVISAALQDAVTRVGDIRWEKTARRLTIAFSRFRWETAGRERVFAGFQLGGVEAVRARNVRREAKDAVLELLAVTFEPAEAPGGRIVLAFADGADIAVEVECVDAALADLSDPWRAPHKPGHEV
jgi:hypothetical protein